MLWFDEKHFHHAVDEAARRPGATAAPWQDGEGPQTMDEMQAYWQREMLHIFARNQLRVALAMPLLAGLFAVANLVWVPMPVVIAWLAAYFVVEVAQLALARHCLRARPEGTQVRTWVHPFAFSELAHAVVWFLPLLLFWREEAIPQHLFIGASLMAAMAIRILVANNFLPLVTAGSGVIALALALRAIIAGDTIHLAMAGMIVVLGIFFLQLARRLQTTTKELLLFRAQRERLIEELQQQRDAAEQARRQAEEANRAKSRFLAAMSHELRTPLNAIMGFSEIISAEMLGPVQVERYKEYATDIHRSGNYLLNLINDILDLSRIEAGKVEMREEVVDMVAEAKSALDMVSIKAEARGQKLRLDGPEGEVELLGNARYIRQIWINLLGNAIKFTPEGGEITAAIRRLQGGNLALEVRDTGEGIPRNELRSVMRSFSRGASAVRKAVDGAGLGLAIVNGLARLHDARLEIESEVGRGTTVRIVFPARRVVTAARADFIRGDETESPLERQLILLTA